MQGFYGIVVAMTVCNYFLHKAIDKPNKDVEELLKASSDYIKILLPDIIIKIIGLILALFIYLPIMMYSVLLAAIYTISMKHINEKRNYNKDHKI